MILGGSDTSLANIDSDSQASASKARLEEDLNRFLSLLVTQLENQDPLDPMDSSEFTSQLVQFASVEQQIFANANLEKLLNLQQTSQIADMVNFIGNTIETVGSVVPLDNGEAKFTYAFDTNAANVTIAIRDASGLTVFSTPGQTDAGRHVFEWDGLKSNGATAVDGPYTIIIGATDRGGDLLDIAQTVFGRVTGAGAEDGVVSLFMGDVTTTMDRVLAIVENEQQVVEEQ